MEIILVSYTKIYFSKNHCAKLIKHYQRFVIYLGSPQLLKSDSENVSFICRLILHTFKMYARGSSKELWQITKWAQNPLSNDTIYLQTRLILFTCFCQSSLSTESTYIIDKISLKKARSSNVCISLLNHFSFGRRTFIDMSLTKNHILFPSSSKESYADYIFQMKSKKVQINFDIEKKIQK